MKRECGSMATKPHVKERYRSVFTALSSEAKSYPGGISELARITGRNPTVLANALNPNQLDAAPTAEGLLEVVEAIGAKRTVNAIACLAGQVSVDVGSSLQSPREVTAAFMHLVKDTAKATEHLAEALEDGRLDADERQSGGALLDELIAAAVEMRALVRG